MRRKARVDENQQEIVNALRQVGCSVVSLAPIGDGCPDLLVGHRGRNLLLEVKDGAKPPSKRKLTPDEEEWIGNWRGQVAVVYEVDDALELLR